MTQLFAAILLLWCPQTSAAATQTSPQTQDKVISSVPFKLLASKHMAVQVKLNGKGPFRLIFDLGSPVNLISGRAAAESGIISKEAAGKPAFFGMRGQKKVMEFTVGDVSASDVSVMVMDHPTIKAASAYVGRLDGIVGYPFYAQYVFSINYQSSEMQFSPSGYKPQDVMTKMMGRMFAATSPTVIGGTNLWGIELSKDDDQPGVRVQKVWTESPAETAGIQPGDVILTIDSRWTDQNLDAADAVSVTPSGFPCEIKLKRSGVERVLTLTPRQGI